MRVVMPETEPRNGLGVWGFVGYYFLFLMVGGTVLNIVTNSNSGTYICGIGGFIFAYVIDRKLKASHRVWVKERQKDN